MNRSIPLLAALALAIAAPLSAAPPAPSAALDPAAPRAVNDETSRFIFFSVLEGLYDYGVSSEDTAQILMRRPGETYYHFILACPICTAAIWAFEAYRDRPKVLYSVKSGASTFGPGLSAQFRKQLYSDDPTQRLTAINTLVKEWIERRMTRMNLSADERAALIKDLEKKREEGMNQLKAFRKKAHGPKLGVEQAAPAYVNLDECAVCNAAAGKPMKLPE